jgi:S-adenosylmethionine-dependent methyltransferase
MCLMGSVADFYNADPSREWNRLQQERLEWHVTWQYLSRLLQPGSRVLDVGGGPGRYALALAALGHHVTLVDLAERNVAFARAKAEEQGVTVEGLHQGDARDLSRFPDGSFDVVLLLGPLYHLIGPEDRDRALRECLRVLRPEGTCVVAFLSIWAPLYDSVVPSPEGIGEWRRRLQAGHLRDGIYRPEPDHPIFTEAWFVDPFLIEQILEPYGLEKIHLVGAEGMVGQSKHRLYQLPETVLQEWMEFIGETAESGAALGGSGHLVYFGRKG